MEELLQDILRALRMRSDGSPLPPEELEHLIRRRRRKTSKKADRNGPPLMKRQLLPWYLDVRQHDGERWQSWNISPDLEQSLLETITLKPRRTASGVATITVICRPAPCGGDCLYCPNDLRMPKSYLHDEPACQRAEHCLFDPYLQVWTRLTALSQMGHATDKVELIVLGGTWNDYPESYRFWFVRELFRALNDWPDGEEGVRDRLAAYQELDLTADADELADFVASEQDLVNRGLRTYNQGFQELYGKSSPHQTAALRMTATATEVSREQRRNESAAHRVVGLVMETRPDEVTPESLTQLRELGCTKVQIGVQSTRQEILDANGRGTTTKTVRRAFALIRLFGFKIHAHLMLNLLGATPEDDKADYLTFVSDPAYLPDEVKLYPCALVGGTKLVRHYEDGSWRPYTADELLDVLVTDTLDSPSYLRISRMIRDISADDILAGNRHANLRQMVEERIRKEGSAGRVREIRFREINQEEVDLKSLVLDELAYETTVSHERFLQWVTPDKRIAGFCRLSLPKWEELAQGVCNVHASELPAHPGEAMIRELHVYGRAARLGTSGDGAQHHGLGRSLVTRACEIARQEGFDAINVISAVGTREYYRRLGFDDAGLYQRKKL